MLSEAQNLSIVPQSKHDMEVVAIVGRPNVGKSTLFNRMIRKNRTITHELPGVTRDRIYGVYRDEDCVFSLIDTGGIMPDPESMIEKNIQEQVDFAIKEAKLVLFVTDFRQGDVDVLDHDLLRQLRKKGKPIILVVNKVDHQRRAEEIVPYDQLGIKDVCPVSALHKKGMDELYDKIKSHLPDSLSVHEESLDESRVPRIAVIGKPNVGKSSLINYILNTDRLIVDDVPGTTRDTVDVRMEYKNQTFIFIDTAGLRRKRKVTNQFEILSNLRAVRSLRDVQIVILMVDTTNGITDQDMKVIHLIAEHGCGLILIVNKWDLISNVTQENYLRFIDDRLRQPRYFDVVFMSVKEGRNVQSIFDRIVEIQILFNRKVSTSVVNQLLRTAVARTQPPVLKSKRAKFYYATQTSVFPPVFLIFVNDRKYVARSYQQYLENYFQDRLGYFGIRARLSYKNRPREARQTSRSPKSSARSSKSSAKLRRPKPFKGKKPTKQKLQKRLKHKKRR